MTHWSSAFDSWDSSKASWVVDDDYCYLLAWCNSYMGPTNQTLVTFTKMKSCSGAHGTWRWRKQHINSIMLNRQVHEERFHKEGSHEGERKGGGGSEKFNYNYGETLSATCRLEFHVTSLPLPSTRRTENTRTSVNTRMLVHFQPKTRRGASSEKEKGLSGSQSGLSFHPIELSLPDKIDKRGIS